jgi:hypothetical protein
MVIPPAQRAELNGEYNADILTVPSPTSAPIGEFVDCRKQCYQCSVGKITN